MYGPISNRKRVLATILTNSRDLQQHWRSGAPSGVANPGPVFEPRVPIQGARGIMYFLDGVLVGVQAPPWVVHQWLLFAFSFSDSGAPNHAPPSMGIAAALSYIATVIPLHLRRMMARSKAHLLSVNSSGRPLIGGHQHCQYGNLAGAIESVSRFNGANGS